MMRMHRERSQLLIVDMQEKLLPVINRADSVLANCQRVIRMARRLDVPMTISEQNPKGIGHTVEAVRETAGSGVPVLTKAHFSCMRDEAFCEHIGKLREAGRNQVVLVGIEAHVCVTQTALDLLAGGYETFVVADAVSSRTAENRELALQRMRQAGAIVVDNEAVMFEWLEKAGTPEFRDLLPMLK